MRFSSSIVQSSHATDAVDQLLAGLEDFPPSEPVDFAALFSTAHFEDDLEAVARRLKEALPKATVIGCTAEGTIGTNAELERIPSMSLLAGSMPGVRVCPFHLQQSELESAVTVHDWERCVGVAAESEPTFIALGDPFEANIPAFVDQLNEFYPKSPLVGGIASGGNRPQQNRLLLNGQVITSGIVGVALSGNLAVETVVSQGCRPIGKPFVITKGKQNVIQELGGYAVLQQLRNVLVDLPEADEALARQALFVGRVIDERKEYFSKGDFLIHNIIGIDRENGAIGIAGHARVGSTVQFHVRDAATADADLRAMLAPYAEEAIPGGLLFGCNGRGTSMWPIPGHDAGVVHETVGDIPLAGFFCAGEFGPVGGANFIHGFTASIALFRDRQDTQ